MGRSDRMGVTRQNPQAVVMVTRSTRPMTSTEDCLLGAKKRS
jgi:hypothetical protein